MIHAATLALYIAALVLWVRSLVQGPDRGTGAAGWVAAAGVATHLLAIIAFTLEWGELPLVGLAPSLSTLAFLTGVALLFTLTLGEAARVGILLVPLMIVLEASAMVLGIRPAPADLDFQGAWFSFHVTLALASIGAMALAAAAGALWLFQFRELKARRLGRAFHFLPPLATLDRIGRVGVLAGFITLSISLGLGWAWTYSFRHSLEVADPKILWAIFIWAVVGATLFMRRGGESERRGAMGSVLAFGLIVVSYLLVRATEDGGFFL